MHKDVIRTRALITRYVYYLDGPRKHYVFYYPNTQISNILTNKNIFATLKVDRIRQNIYLINKFYKIKLKVKIYLKHKKPRLKIEVFYVLACYRSFSVISANKHNISDIIPNRTVIFDSGQPSSSK